MCGLRAGSKRLYARGGESIYKARDQRRLGTHHDEVNFLVLGKLQ